MPRNLSRLALLVGAALLAGAPALHAQQTGAPVRGDVDGDGRVTAADARIVSDFLVGKAVPAGANVRERGDVNGDGRVTAVDAAIIARAAAGRDVSRFPVGRPAPEGALGVLECDANIGARTLSCNAPGVPSSPGGARGDVIYSGANGTYVRLNTPPANIVVDSVQHTYSFTATVQNLLVQAVGVNTEGAADSTGVRVFFDPLPYVDIPAGSGLNMTVINPSGTGKTFLKTNQTYFEYFGAELGPNGILSPGETSAEKTWVFGWQDGAVHFKFRVYISTAMQYPQGWIDIYPPPPPARQDSSPTFIPTKTLHVGETAVLTGTVRNHLGNPLGTPVQNWTITSHHAASIGAPTSDSTIVVTADSVGTDTITATTGARSGRIAIVVVPGAPANMVKSAGDGQSATVGTAVATPPAVKITDAANNPVPGVPVTFTPVAGSGSVTGGSATTDASGVATVGSWTLGTAAGLDSLVASSPGLTSVTFTATATAGAPTNMVKSAGDAQTDTAGSAVATAPEVTVTDANTNPVAGVMVHFTVTGGGGSVTPDSVATNSLGKAALTSWTLGSTAGANTLDASATGLTTVTFTATGIAGAPANMVKSAGDGQSAPAGSAVPIAPAVTITDANNNPVSGVSVTFAVASGGGSVTGATTSTNASGVATVGSWTLGSTAGVNTLDASSTGLTTVTFTATGTAPPTAVNDGPTANSVPGNPYHTALDATYTLLAAQGLLANDTRGFPLATVAFFGGGDLGGTVTGHAAGSTVSPLPGHADGSLTVNADGSVTFTPYTGFTGLYTFQYRITNTVGSSDAQVTIAVGVRPAANNLAYPHTLLGNVPINTFNSSKLKVPVSGDKIVLNVGTQTNGTATINADSTFTFKPNAGFTGGTASFTYTVTNGFGTSAEGTVSMTVSGIAWFIDKGAAAGDGRFGTPFNDLSTAFAAATKPQANQPIFLYHDPASYTGGVTLLASQRLVGEGATGASFEAVMGVTWPVDAAAQPTINGTNPTVNNGLTLGSGNTLRGFDLTGTSGLTGSGFGTLTFSQVGINTTGQALNLTTSGTLSGSFTGVTSSGGTNNIVLSGVTLSGAVGLGGGALSGATGTALSLTNVTSATASDVLSYSGSVANSSAGASVGVSGGSVRLSLTGNVSQAGAGAVVSVSGTHTGTLTFSSGTVSASTGTGLQFNDADGTYAFNNGVSLTGGDAGIDVLNNSGGTFTFPAGSQITNPTNEAIRVNASAPTFSYLGRIDKTNGSTGISVTSNTGGSVALGSRLKSFSSGSSTAVNLASNGGVTITSLDSLQIVSGSGAGLSATGGGTVTVQGANNTVNSNGGGTAVNVSSTTIGAGGMTFKRIDATGSGTNGIVLSSTGAGAFTVTGDGASDAANTTRGRTTAKSGGGTVVLGSGGSISGRSGDGISLNSTGAVTLRNLVITGSASSGDGIDATSVSGLTIDNTRITGHTNNSAVFSTSVSAPVILHSEMENNAFGAGAPGADIHNVRLISNTGTGSVQSSVIANTSAGAERQLQIFSTTGTLNITVSNTRISGSTVGDGASVYAYGSSNITASFQGDSIHNNSAFGIDAGTETTQSSSLNITVNNTKFHNNFVGVTVAHGSSGTNTFNITNNNFQNHGSVSININRLGAVSFTGFGLFSGTVSGNTIGTAGVANSGSPLGSNTIDVKTNSNGGTIQVAILNNTIREIGNDGIRVVGRDANTGHTLHARIENNNIANFHASALSGIRGELGAAAGDKITMCLDIENNTVSGAPQNGIRVRSVAGGSPPPQITLTMPAYDGTGATYLANRNPSGGTTSFANGNAGSTTTAGNCTTP